MYKFNVEKTTKEIIAWIQDWFSLNGNGCNAVVGISGGKDSSVVAALCVAALGKDRVIGVLMPNGEQSDIDMAYKLVEHLGIENYTVDIHGAIKSLKHEIKPQLCDHWSMQTSTNLPARIRMATLYAIAQTLNGRVANTCNLSEDWVGYATRYGDGAGDFSPLSLLTTDEDNLGFSYAILNRYIRTGECEDENIKHKIDSMHKKNIFKLKPMPVYTPNDLPVAI